MIIGGRQVGVLAYAAPVDMRKSFNALSALVEEELGRRVLSGTLFLFTSKNRKRAKVLYFDGTGLCLGWELEPYAPSWSGKSTWKSKKAVPPDAENYWRGGLGWDCFDYNQPCSVESDLGYHHWETTLNLEYDLKHPERR